MDEETRKKKVTELLEKTKSVMKCILFSYVLNPFS